MLAQQIIIDQKYCYNETTKNILGKGGYGTVYHGQTIDGQQQLAIKKIILKGGEQQIQQLIKSTVAEANALAKLHHKSIVKLINVKFTDDVLYIISEYCEGTTLHEFIVQNHKATGQGIPEQEIHSIMKQLAETFMYMHSQKLSHRDLKPENIMINRGQIKLLDFGLAKEIQSDDEQSNTFIGTPIFMHPRILDEMSYDAKMADMWALGVSLHYMVYYQPNDFKSSYPFYADPKKAGFQNNLRIDIEQKLNQKHIELPQSRKVSEELKSLIKSMLSTQKQLTWIELFKHYQVTLSTPETMIVADIDPKCSETIRKTINIDQEEKEIVIKINTFVSKIMLIEQVAKQLIVLQQLYNMKDMLSVFKVKILELWQLLLQCQKKINDSSDSTVVVLDGYQWIKFKKSNKFQEFKVFIHNHSKTFEKLQLKETYLIRDSLPPKYVFQQFKVHLLDINQEEGLKSFDLQLIDFLYNLMVMAQWDELLKDKQFDIVEFVSMKSQISPYKYLNKVIEFYLENDL